jgi:peptide/nickel transport system permease protein
MTLSSEGQKWQDVPRPRAARVRIALGYVVRDVPLGAALLLMSVLVLMALFGNALWRHDPLSVDVGSALEPPSAAHPMGTDGVGRDILARFQAGAPIALAIGAAVVVVGAFVGGTIGLIAGTSRGWIDQVLMRSMDAILAFPPLALAMATTIAFGGGLESAALGITITSLPYFARLVRSDVVRLRALPSVEAAVAIGASRARILYRHIVPHLLSTILIQGAALFGYSILTLAALGFVGLGAQPPTPEWGAMITDGLQYALTGQWWIGVFPGLGLLALVTAMSLIADRTRDFLDPAGRYAFV